MSDQTERMQILDMIENGKISAEDGLSLLKALVENQLESEVDDVDALESMDVAEADPGIQPPSIHTENPARSAINDPVHPGSTSLPGEKETRDNSFAGTVENPSTEHTESISLEPKKWKNFWMIPFWIGAAILTLGGVLMYRSIAAAGVGFGFILATLPFILGLLIVVFAWQSRTSPWIHLRITQAPGEKPAHIAFSFPLPIRPAMWFFRTFGNKIPKIQEFSMDKILLAVDQSAHADNPIYIQVDEGEQGEKVEIFIG